MRNQSSKEKYYKPTIHIKLPRLKLNNLFFFHSWPEFLNFLHVSQENAQKKCPSLCDIPQKPKPRIPVTPSPIDELSEETKSRLVSKLRKKVIYQKMFSFGDSCGYEGSKLLPKSYINFGRGLCIFP